MIEFAADLETPVSAFIKLSPLQPVFLLESAERNETVGRYSFLGILPREYFVLTDLQKASPFFSSLASVLSRLKAGDGGRLGTGLVGFLSYDSVGMFHPHLKVKPSGVPLSAFVLPSAILTFDHLKRKMLFTSILDEDEQNDLLAQIRKCLASPIALPPPGKASEPVSPIQKADFFEMV
ncbi:MAG TPA: hypothetical protein VFG11_07580, partial [Acidobacteriota bacterium]|nr:hypothetical protein [Acidobacteriota bacterium]